MQFVRCIKTNRSMNSNNLDRQLVSEQVSYSGLSWVIELMSQGYPSRISMVELREMFRPYLPTELVHLEPKTFCMEILRVVGLEKEDYQFGQSKVFFRLGKFSKIDSLKEDTASLQSIADNLKKHRIIILKWKKLIFKLLSVKKCKFFTIICTYSYLTVEGLN